MHTLTPTLTLAHSAGPAIHSLPPSIEYETEYCATGVFSCSIPQYSVPSKPTAGSLAPGLDLVRVWEFGLGAGGKGWG